MSDDRAMITYLARGLDTTNHRVLKLEKAVAALQAPKPEASATPDLSAELGMANMQIQQLELEACEGRRRMAKDAATIKELESKLEEAVVAEKKGLLS